MYTHWPGSSPLAYETTLGPMSVHILHEYKSLRVKSPGHLFQSKEIHSRARTSRCGMKVLNTGADRVADKRVLGYFMP